MAVAVETERPKQNIRTKLRDAADERYDKLLAAIDMAIDAEKTWQLACSNCGKREPVRMPDVRAQMDAAKFLLEQGHGAVNRAPTVEAQPMDSGELAGLLADDLAEWKRAEILAILSAPDGPAGQRVRAPVTPSPAD